MSSDLVSKVPIHPRIIIQPDWFRNFKSNTLPVNVWLEFKSGNSNLSSITENIHGTCSIKSFAEAETQRYEVSCSDKFQSGDIDREQLRMEIKMQDNKFSHSFQGPTTSFTTTVDNSENHERNVDLSRISITKSFNSIHPHCFDISSGGVGLTALSNGIITIWDINNGQLRRRLKGHIEDVYVSRFFPFDFALVSGGADMRVKIWSLNSENDHIRDGTLNGHYSRINDVLPLDSQHILSASNDGSAILWDIQKSESIQKIVQLNQNSLNSISLIDSSMLACGFHDGFVRFYQRNSATTNELIHQINFGASISTLCYLAESKQLVCGNDHSIIGIYDVRQLKIEPMYIWKEQRGRINAIVPGRDRAAILVATSDGSCFEYKQNNLQNIINQTEFHVDEYTGADDSLSNAKVHNNKIFSACRDNFIRVYGDRKDN